MNSNEAIIPVTGSQAYQALQQEAVALPVLCYGGCASIQPKSKAWCSRIPLHARISTNTKRKTDLSLSIYPSQHYIFPRESKMLSIQAGGFSDCTPIPAFIKPVQFCR